MSDSHTQHSLDIQKKPSPASSALPSASPSASPLHTVETSITNALVPDLSPAPAPASDTAPIAAPLSSSPVSDDMDNSSIPSSSTGAAINTPVGSLPSTSPVSNTAAPSTNYKTGSSPSPTSYVVSPDNIPPPSTTKLSGIMADSTALVDMQTSSGFDPAPQRPGSGPATSAAPVLIRIRHLPEFTTNDQVRFMLQFCADGDVVDVETRPADATTRDAGLATAHVTLRSRHVADDISHALDGKMNIRGTATLIIELASASNTPTQTFGRLRGRVSPAVTSVSGIGNGLGAGAGAGTVPNSSPGPGSSAGHSPGPGSAHVHAPIHATTTSSGGNATPAAPSRASALNAADAAAAAGPARYAFGTLPTGSEFPSRQTGKDLIGGSDANHDDDNELLSIPFNNGSNAFANVSSNGSGSTAAAAVAAAAATAAASVSGMTPPPGAIPLVPAYGAGALPPLSSQRRATVAHIPMLNALAGLTPLNTTNLNGAMLFHPVTGPTSAISPLVGSNILSPLSNLGNIHAPFTAGPTPGPSFRRGSNFPSANPADQNPPCNTLYVGNLPAGTTEDELKEVFTTVKGYKRLCYRVKANGPMCFVEFEDIQHATKCLNDMYGYLLPRSNKHGIRLSFSKNPLGVRSMPQTNMPAATLPNLGGPHAVPAFPNANGPPPGLSMPPGLALNSRSVSNNSSGGVGAANAAGSGSGSGTAAAATTTTINTKLASEMSLLSTSASTTSAGGASSSASSSASPSVPAYYPASASTITANPWNSGPSVFGSGSGSGATGSGLFDAARGFGAFHSVQATEQAQAQAQAQTQANTALFPSHMMGH